MSRRSSVPALFAAVVLALSSAVRSYADDLADYLEERGLTQLLVLHLEERLQEANDEQRPALAVRLAELYAELLETTRDVSLRVDLEARSRDLLQLVPDESADELRLALLRGSYSNAEKTAENHRLRLSDDESVRRAIATLAESIPQFHALRDTLQQRLDVAERRRSRSRGAETAQLNQEVDTLTQLHARTVFLLAWAQYYHAWLAGSADEARLAEDLFGEIIDPEVGRLTPDDVSRDLLATDSFARAVLGMALAKSLTAGPDSALRWIDLLELEQTVEPLRAQASAWRMAILLEHGEFREVRHVLEGAAAEPTDDREEQALPLAWLRLAAVHALEAANENVDAADLARFAIAQLASSGELPQVLDLAQRFGVEWMGDRGFAALYVRGAQTYQQARDRHDGDEPTTDSELAAMYQEAATHLEGAASQPDAVEFARAAAGARSIIGWCHYFSGRFFEARRAFESASDQLPPTEAVEALWMAIVSLDKVVQASADEARQLELDALIRKFLERYPSSEYAPRLVVRQAEQGVAEPTLELVEELLNVPPNSLTYAAAQERAENMLYQLFRAAVGDERIELGERFLAVAMPRWLAVDIESLPDDAARTIFVVRARRILETALTPGVERPRAAEQVLVRLDGLAADGAVDLAEALDEIDYRRFQWMMLEGDRAAAETVADSMWERQSDSAWTVAAVRALFKTAVDQWRESPAGEIPNIALLNRIIHFGGRTIQELDDSGRSLNEPAVATAFATVAEALMTKWESTGQSEDGERAHFLYDRLLAANANNSIFLRAIGILAPEFGDRAQAVSAWRKLAAGTDAGTEPWLEAKFHLIALLAKDDPAHAREVLDQHKALYPEYGPPPWDEQFRLLDESLPAAPASDEGAAENGPVNPDDSDQPQEKDAGGGERSDDGGMSA